MRDRKCESGAGREPRPFGGIRVCILALATLTLLGACSNTQLANHRLEQRVVARKDVRGALIVIRFVLEDPPRAMSGELLAASADSTHILVDDSLVVVHVDDMLRADLAVYDPPGEVRKDALVLTHATSADSRWDGGGFGSIPWKKLAKYARFPQGLTTEFERRPAP